MKKNTLVIGGTGKTGRRIVERLELRGLPVRVGSRSSEPAFDWADPASWPRALAGVDAAYVSYYPDLAAPGATDAIRSLTQTAIEQGVKQLVLLSGRGEPEAQACEDIVRSSGLDWTVVRASWFSQNFSEGYLLDSIRAGEVALPAGNVGEPFIDTDDIADVAVAALTEDRHVGQLYEVTGPRLMTFAEAVAEIARATGRQIRYVQVTIEEYIAALEQLQLEPELISLITYLFTEVLDGRNESMSDGVMRALGRPARDFSDYARAAAAAGAWK
ncbi:MAG: NAD(P)H-binding protein [Steroidobacteraceae bacterium]